MLSRLQQFVEGYFQSSAGVFRRLGLSPNSVTVFGFVATVGASFLLASGLTSTESQIVAVLVLLIVGYFDALDGAMARRYKLVSKLGGVMDSILDRAGELLLFGGLAVGGLVDLIVVLWALGGSFLVSYSRARAEVEGIVMKGIGIAERPERLLIMVFSLALYPVFSLSLYWGTLLIALLATVTIFERLYRIRLAIRREGQILGS